VKKYKFSSAVPREMFQYVRNQTNRFNLRLRMILLIGLVLFVSAALATLVALLLEPYFSSTILLTLTFTLTSLIIGLGITSIISKVFFAPIKNVIRGMEHVADGDFSTRLEGNSSSKEVMELYTGFNMMAHELGAMEMLQSDFVSNVSHEFKTPINAIEGYSMLLQGSDNLSREEEQYVEKIVFNTQRLSSLVGSILLLSKLENQQIQTRKSVYNLDEQIRHSIVDMEPVWAEKEVEFDVELEEIQYEGNEAMMRHVWDNLIGNAVKFGPRGGTVRLKLSRREKEIVFTVDDEGEGMDDESIKHIYDKFYQGDSSHKSEGNGLGLALVKRILTLENGSISAENLPDGGCRFTVVLSEV